MDIEKEDVAKLLEDPAFMEAVISAVLADSDAVQDLAEEVANALEDATFVAKVTKALVEELTD